MQEIRKIDLDGKSVHLKDGALGWRVVAPIKNEDGTINWFNLLLGGKRGLAFLIFVMILTILFYFGVNELVATYKEVAEDPCTYCEDCAQAGRPDLTNYNNIVLENVWSKNESSD